MEMRKLGNEELHRLSVAQYKETPKIPVIVVLDNIRSLNNIGSVFRTADAFCIQKIYLCGITATPPNKEIHKTALGATDSVAWEYVENTLLAVEKLKEQGVYIISIEQAENSTMLNDFEPNRNQKYAIIFGNEVKGVEQEVVSASDEVIEIPQYGTKHSLNISVSAGIAIWELAMKLRKHTML